MSDVGTTSWFLLPSSTYWAAGQRVSQTDWSCTQGSTYRSEHPPVFNSQVAKILGVQLHLDCFAEAVSLDMATDDFHGGLWATICGQNLGIADVGGCILST